jgi:hypothetical protein
MKRFVVLFAVIGLIVATSGCSVKEVQLWFQVHQHSSISADQAKSIADVVNAKRTPGCDPFYTADGPLASPCVPDNVASVHCVGTNGDGPAVAGPLKVGGYDPFDLDKDGDKAACVDPVGSVDVLGQVLDSNIHVAGWTFDPNTTDPIHYTVSDNGTMTDNVANGTRTDIAAAYPGVGSTHGFDLTIDESTSPAATHQICITAKNTGAGADQKLGCKTITLIGVHDSSSTGHEVVGVIEGADRVPGGIHIRGLAWDGFSPSTINTLPSLSIGSADDPTVVTSLTGKQTVARPDAVSFYDLAGGTATYGFDFVQPAPAGSSLGDASSICLYDSTNTASNVQMMCRPINS